MKFRHTVGLLLLAVSVACATTPITGRRYFSLLSEGQENQQGQQAYQEIMSKERETGNLAVRRQVEAVARRIIAVSDRPDYQWEVRILDSATPNAFCLPGGKMAVYTGILRYAQNEAGLAAIIGHEAGHALARHGGQRVSQQLGMSLGLTILGETLLSDSKYKNITLAALGAGATLGLILPYSRSHESEADEIGIILMARAGYDPHEASEFWERFGRASEGKEPPQFLSTHPSNEARRAHLTELLAKALPVYQQSAQKLGLGATLVLP